MIILKNENEIDLMRKAGKILGETLNLLKEKVRPGITTTELDRIAEEFITKHGATPSFKGLYGFPASLCISVNNQVIHGFPGSYELKDGDIVSIDCGVCLNGFHSDAARTFGVGNISEEAEKLIRITEESFLKGIEKAYVDNRLTDISNEFHMTEAQAGVMITAYSWTVTLLSLPLMLLVCRIQPKKLLLGTLSVFAVCQVLSVISSGFTFLVLSRIGVACAHSIFWAIASPVAVRVVAKEHQSKALSAIITGTSIAMVLGMPLGRMIGLQIGWRMTFLCVAIVSFLVLGYLAFVFPKLEGTESFSVGQLPELFKNTRLMSIYVITFLVATGYYTSYSYIEPFLQKVAGLPSNWVTMALMLFGVAGLGGSYLF